MPFNKCKGIGKENNNYNHSNVREDSIPFEKANFYQLPNGNIIHRDDYKTQDVVDWAMRKKDLL